MVFVNKLSINVVELLVTFVDLVITGNQLFEYIYLIKSRVSGCFSAFKIDIIGTDHMTYLSFSFYLCTNCSSLKVDVKVPGGRYNTPLIISF